jgi:lysophospholipase L1-like esterase
MRKFKCTDKKITRIGRTLLSEETLWCGLSGSGILFATDSTDIEITFIGDSSTRGDVTEGIARTAVYADGVRVLDFLMDKPKLTQRVSGLESGKRHVIQVIKISECAMSMIGIGEISINEGSDIFKEKQPDFKIEFVGDSITCGYGVDMEDCLVPFRTDTEDCTKAYAFRTAAKLGAALSLVSYSGFGIISGYTEEDLPLVNELVPPLYEKTGFCYAVTDKGEKLQDNAWDFAAYVPDLVVVNLGTNDASYCKDIPERLESFSHMYTEFLKVIHKNNPNARLLLTLGLMSALSFDAVKKAAADFTKETGFKDIYTLELELQKPEDGLVSDYHPTCISHEKAACALTEKIREIFQISL